MKAKTQDREYLNNQYALEQVFHQRMMAESDAQKRKRLYIEAYEQAYQVIHDLSSGITDFGYQQTEVTILKSVLKDKTVIDYGCGYGASTLHLAQYAKRVVGCDIIAFSVEKAQERLMQAGLSNVRFQQVEPAELDFQDQSADVIYASDVIEHLHPEDAKHFLREAFRVLRPQGLLVCITPHRIYGPSDISRYFLPIGSKSTGLHLQEYNYRELMTLMKQAGFQSFLTPVLSHRYLAKWPKKMTSCFFMPAWVRAGFENLPLIQRFLWLRKMVGLNRSIYLLAAKKSE